MRKTTWNNKYKFLNAKPLRKLFGRDRVAPRGSHFSSGKKQWATPQSPSAKIRLTSSRENRDFCWAIFFGQWVHISGGSGPGVDYTALRPGMDRVGRDGRRRVFDVERKHRQLRRLSATGPPFIRAIITDLKLPAWSCSVVAPNNETLHAQYDSQKRPWA